MVGVATVASAKIINIPEKTSSKKFFRSKNKELITSAEIPPDPSPSRRGRTEPAPSPNPSPNRPRPQPETSSIHQPCTSKCLTAGSKGKEPGKGKGKEPGIGKGKGKE